MGLQGGGGVQYPLIGTAAAAAAVIWLLVLLLLLDLVPLLLPPPLHLLVLPLALRAVLGFRGHRCDCGSGLWPSVPGPRDAGPQRGGRSYWPGFCCGVLFPGQSLDPGDATTTGT